MSERWRLGGKRALVTGGTKGIGYAIAAELLHLGATVTITARTEADVQTCVEAWRNAGLNAHGVVADVTTEAGRETIVAAIGDALAILVLNVGTNIRKTTLDTTPDDYAHVMRTNLDAAVFLAQSLHPALSATGDAAIVVVGSVAGAVPVMTGLPYALSKAALDQMTRYLAVEWAGDGIRVNAVDRKSTRLNSSHSTLSRMPSSA